MNASFTTQFPGLRATADCTETSGRTDIRNGSDSQPSDEVLLKEVSSGGTEALSELFKRHARVVRGVAYRVLRDASEADDLLQDIFLLVHRLSVAFDSSKGSARFWILQMAYRRAISRRRYLTSRHFYNHLDLDEAAHQLGDMLAKSGPAGNPMDVALDRHEALQGWFVELSENQRQTLYLFFFEGYTFEEIAIKLGQTVGNARNHYYRGLEKLRTLISAGKLSGKEGHMIQDFSRRSGHLVTKRIP